MSGPAPARIVVAPNAFKGSLTPVEAAAAIAAGLRRARPEAELELVPLADGGDGFLATMLAALGGARRVALVRGPVHAPVAAAFGIAPAATGSTAVVEMAQAAGLALLPAEHLDPLGASTGGVGEVLREARQLGAVRFLVGLGGSATSDGGTGMARALGYRFLDAAGRELPEGGGALRRLTRIDASGFDPSWLLLDVVAVTDVDNPLLGERGAARVYGPQKGASPEQVEVLEQGLTRLAEVAARDLGLDGGALPGAGAAGGLGFGLHAFLGARLEPGAAAVAEAVGLPARLAGAGMLVTGEGRLDAQSGMGKAPAVAGRLARAAGVRAVALVGSVGEGWQALLGDAFDEVRVTTPAGLAPAAAMADAATLLAEAAAGL